MASRVRAGIIYLTFASLLIIGFTSFRRLGAITIHHKAGKINALFEKKEAPLRKGSRPHYPITSSVIPNRSPAKRVRFGEEEQRSE